MGRHLKERVLPIKPLTIAVFAIVCLAATHAQTEPDAKVLRLSAETEDSVVFQVSVGKKIFAREEDIHVNYVVENRSRKNIYLVVEPSPKLIFPDTFTLELAQPVVGPDDHAPFDYDLIKILAGKSYRGKLLIRAKEIIANGKYDFEIAPIRAGFSYLFDISKLSGCKTAKYIRPCLTELYDKSKSLTIGNLVVERKLK